ncbi:MAG: hypothetical protein KC656_05570 [Myxococcales bacterium]|nr:hypothetical protein [Myxococcales bacterium]
MLVADVHRGAGACAMDTAGTVHCVGSPRWVGHFDDPPYRGLSGSLGGVCALKGEGTVVCNDGSVHEPGPVEALVAAAYAYLEPDGTLVERADAAVSFCVLLEGGEIACNGPRYPADLLDALER